MYTALWENGTAAEDGTRLVSIGLGRLSKLVRLAESNCRQNVRSLARKLAVEEVKPEHSASGTGKTYRVYGYAAILSRRKAAGMEWVIRTKGVAFVDPDTGREIVSVPPTESVGGTVSVGGPPIETVGGPPIETVPPFRNSFREITEETTSTTTTAPAVVAEAVRTYAGLADDQAIAALGEACRRECPGVADAEIAELVHEKGRVMQAAPGKYRNPVGFLLEAVPRSCTPAVVGAIRERLRLAAAAERQQREREAAADVVRRKQAQALLADPGSSERERQMARAVLAG